MSQRAARAKKVVILAGGKGARLAEETSVRPKPMVETGPWPILRHLIKVYATHRDAVWVQDLMRRLSETGQLAGFRHNRFGHAMDTLWDVHSWQTIWQSGPAPWTMPRFSRETMLSTLNLVETVV